MSNKENILAIAVDLGAAHTGVASYSYEKGTALGKVTERQGRVYNLEKNAYTVLLDARTAQRHQRRGFDRRQMVKRLFKVIWTQHFQLGWDKDVQQLSSFLCNRRGFSFLAEEHSPEVMQYFPEEAVDFLLEQGLCSKSSLNKDDLSSVEVEGAVYYQLNDFLDELAKNEEQLHTIHRVIEEKTAAIRRQIVLADHITWAKNYKSIKDKNKDKLSDVAKWIIDELKISGILPKGKESYKYDLLKFLQENEAEVPNIIANFPPIDAEALKQDPWNFKPEAFKVEKVKEDFDKNDLKKNNAKAHIQHLAFAIYNTKKELESGARHRSKYFEEIKAVLEDAGHKEKYLQSFYQKLKSGEYSGFNATKLTNLIGNLSNLELKPLRKYFNDPKHKTQNQGDKQDENQGENSGDYWCEKRFAKYYFNWVLTEWRVNSAKDKSKADDGPYAYKKLKAEITEQLGSLATIKAGKFSENSVVDFLCNRDPNWTVPPYQDNNNRKPPKCQSLILNPQYLDEKYPDWQNWLGKLRESAKDFLADFEAELGNLKSGKGVSYFVDGLKQASGQRDRKDLDARVLQFILDRVKATDALRLNEIYGLAKKVKQNASSTAEKADFASQLNLVLKGSALPADLKSEHTAGIFAQKSFLHFSCQYYKQRQRAKDGRLYIMPEYRWDKKDRCFRSTGRFDAAGHLLSYCNHKPRQKRYQLLNDLAGVLQVPPKILAAKLPKLQKAQTVDDAEIIAWLKQDIFKIGRSTIESVSAKAVELQKKYRGALKLELNRALFKEKLEKIKKKKDKTDQEQELLEKYSKSKPPNTDEKSLIALDANIKDLSRAISAELGLGEEHTKKINSMFSFAQMHQIAFEDRSGNANTCAVCSADNAHRMQSEGEGAKAQRLPAISTRIIDGGVKKYVTILARHIVKDNWSHVQEALAAGKNVHIPIITESNAFEFEPSLAELKGKTLKKKRRDALAKSDPDVLFKKKEDRIKAASFGISAYSGAALGDGAFNGEKEELDHIIPRSHKIYGTLNDEANLICVTKGDNNDKGKTIYSLKNLSSRYKQAQFGDTNDATIKKQIEDAIWDSEAESFKFGRYQNFINLEPEQQKAFRHALFLEEGNEIRQAVITAIDNRNRAFVNGTQRYFAEVVANTFYLRAKNEELDAANLSFDFFGVEAFRPNSAGNNIKELRKWHEERDPELAEYAKAKDPRQKNYSHLIDAMLAFCIAAEQHKNEGSMGLQIGADYDLFDEDKQSIFAQMKVSDKDFKVEKLARRQAYEVETHFRQSLQEKGFYSKAIPYQIHRDSIIAEKFFPILEIAAKEHRYGFSLGNSISIPSTEIDLIRKFISPSEKQHRAAYKVWLIDKTKALDYLMKFGSVKASKEQEKTAKILDKLAYTTIKKEISGFLTGKSAQAPNTVEEALNVFDDLVVKKEFTKSKILLPCYGEWRKLRSQMEKEAGGSTPLQEFLAKCELFQNIVQKNKHQKVRKVYSLPVAATIGSIRLKRRTWDNASIYQLVADAGLAKYGFDAKSRPLSILSKNSVPKGHYAGAEENPVPEALSWITVDKNGLAGSTILGLEIKNRSAGQVIVRAVLSSLDAICLKEENWEGSIEYSAEMNRPENKDKFFIAKEDFYWLEGLKPLFDGGKTRAKLSVKKNTDGTYTVEFVMAKGNREKEWLKNEAPAD